MTKKPKKIKKHKIAERTGLDDLVMVRIARISEIFLRLAPLTIGKKWGLRNTDLRLLNVLDHSGKLSIREISRRTHVDKAWVSRSIGELEKKKLVQRHSDPLDTRLSLASLTKKGQEILDEVRPFSLESEKTLMSKMDGVKLKKMLDQLEANAAEILEGITE